MKEEVLGYSVDALPPATILRDIESHVLVGPSGTGTAKWLACFNPHSYAVSLRDSRFSEALKSSDWLVPDGIGVVMASILLGGFIRRRITGFDVYENLMASMNARGGCRVFFLGSTEHVLRLIERNVSRDYPNIVIAGVHSPPFSDEWSDEQVAGMVSLVNRACADVLWVGMTAPKQEKWISDNIVHLNVRFAGAIGAVFNFYAGNVKRSPRIFRRLGLEWLPRLVQEPRRLWRRVFISAPVFIRDALLVRVLGSYLKA